MDLLVQIIVELIKALAGVSKKNDPRSVKIPPRSPVRPTMRTLPPRRPGIASSRQVLVPPRFSPPAVAKPAPPMFAPQPPIPPSPPAAPSASAPSVRQWLRPETLRSQYILTEIFQPPLALREES